MEGKCLEMDNLKQDIEIKKFCSDVDKHIIIRLRRYREEDFQQINKLNSEEGWTNLAENHEDTKRAWENSNVSIVACVDEDVIGYIRGITDYYVTLYICELLIHKSHRGLGIGEALLKLAHQQYPKTRVELLGSSSSQTYYEKLNYRSFYGFRKTINE